MLPIVLFYDKFSKDGLEMSSQEEKEEETKDLEDDIKKSASIKIDTKK
jgi:hypothetical protein